MMREPFVSIRNAAWPFRVMFMECLRGEEGVEPSAKHYTAFSRPSVPPALPGRMTMLNRRDFLAATVLGAGAAPLAMPHPAAAALDDQTWLTYAVNVEM